jgi:hypothetical protein
MVLLAAGSVGARRVHDHDAAARGRFSIDIVDADSGAANDPQFGRLPHQRVVHLYGRTDHQRIGIGKSGGQAVGQLVVRQYFPAGLSRKHRQRGRRNLFRENNLHCLSFFRCGRSVLVKADAFLLAQQVKHAHDSGVGLALAALIFPNGIGVHAQLLRHLVLVEVKLLARDDQLFAE